MLFSTIMLFIFVPLVASRVIGMLGVPGWHWRKGSWHLWFAYSVSAYSELHGLILSSSPFYRFRRVSKLYKVTPLIIDEIVFKPRHLTSEYLVLTVICVDSLETTLALRRKLMVYDNDRLWPKLFFFRSSYMKFAYILNTSIVTVSYVKRGKILYIGHS